jgi:hypothetical protein
VEPDNVWIRPLADGARIHVEVQGRPLSRYAVTLQIRSPAGWQTIFLLDNAHGQHDMHRYTGDTKQPAERFMEGDPQQVVPVAIRLLVSHWEAIVESWKS